MTLEQAMVGRPRTTCKPSAHHKRQKPAADAPRGRCPDRLTSLRHTKPANGRVVRTHYHKRMGFATPRLLPTLRANRAARLAPSECVAGTRKRLVRHSRPSRETEFWESRRP